jgi:3'-phosphoadenosine 5'-phosphosulfate (PAPS) 3'-phosphatase
VGHRGRPNRSRSAGGRVETLAGTPLIYGKPGFKNDGFIAWGRRS